MELEAVGGKEEMRLCLVKVCAQHKHGSSLVGGDCGEI